MMHMSYKAVVAASFTGSYKQHGPYYSRLSFFLKIVLVSMKFTTSIIIRGMLKDNTRLFKSKDEVDGDDIRELKLFLPKTSMNRAITI